MLWRVVVVGVVVALLAAVVARQSPGRGGEQVYIVRPYDTLWSISVAHYTGDPREGVWKLRERNGLETALIRPGQRLVLP